MVTSEQIINEAKSWLGTPFKHQAKVKNIGCDCIGFVAGVLENLGQDFSEHYISDYSEVPDGKKLKEKLDSILKPKSINQILAGDIFLMSFQALPQHVGFISENNDGTPYIIHSYKNAGKVVEHRLNDFWKSKIIGLYSLET